MKFAAGFLATSSSKIDTTTALSGSVYFVTNPDNATFSSSLSSSRVYGTLYFTGGTATGQLVKRAPTGNATIEAIYFDSDSGSDYLLVLSNTSAYGPNISNISSSANAGSSMATELDTYLSAAVPAKLSLATTAAGGASGAAFTTQPVVTIQDSAGNTVTGSSAVVTMTVNAGGTVVGTATATASSGVATFSTVGISGTAGTAYTLTFASTGLTSATQSITPTVGTATQLALTTSAAGAASGAAFTTQPVVTIRDSGGNTVTGSSAVVTMTVNAGGTVVGTATATASSGVATFGTVGISGTAGTAYT
jgi:hypothetical protein